MSKSSKSPFSELSVSSITLYLKRHTYLSVAVVSWVIIALLTVVFVMPQIRLIASEFSDTAAQQKKLDALSTKLKFVQTLDNTELDAQRKTLQGVLPSQKPVTPLISSLEKLASEASVSLKNFELNPGSVATGGAGLSTLTPGTRGLVPGVGSLPLKLELQGGFAQMNTFFKSLDTLIPLINVKTISFTQVSQNGVLISDSTEYKATVELESLYSIQDQATKVDPNEVLIPMTAQDKALLSQLESQVAAQPAATEPVITPFTGGSSTGSNRPTLFSY